MNGRMVRGLLIGVVAVQSLVAVGCGRNMGNTFDIVVRGGRIIDGSGEPAFDGDIGIIGEKIAEIGDLSGRATAKTLDAHGMVVAPGFIDMHSHCAGGLADPDTAANLNYLTQGVTTVQIAPDGYGTWEIAETRAEWEQHGIGTNAFMLVGHGAVRREVVGHEVRAPNEEELDRMKGLIRRAMEEGAWGMSAGLQYVPDRNAETEEVIELARVAARYSGIYHTHQRSEEDEVVEATQETIRIAREGGVRTDLTHLKVSGKSNWGAMADVVRLINEARAQGVEIFADIYPYDMASVGTNSRNFNIPDDLEIELRRGEPGFPDRLAAALADPGTRARIKKLTEEGGPEKDNFAALFGWDAIGIADAAKNKQFIGLTIADLAQEQGRDAFDAAADLYIEEREDVHTSIGIMSEDEITLAMSQDWMMFCSDGYTFHPRELTSDKPRPAHPRSYGSFPRVIRKYALEDGVMSLEEAIRRMTSLPATVLGMTNRGVLAAGNVADIVVFDPETLRDHAAYVDPHQLSTGIVHVLVNGRLSVEDGKPNRALNGRVLLSTTDR